MHPTHLLHVCFTDRTRQVAPCFSVQAHYKADHTFQTLDSMYAAQHQLHTQTDTSHSGIVCCYAEALHVKLDPQMSVKGGGGGVEEGGVRRACNEDWESGLYSILGDVLAVDS